MSNTVLIEEYSAHSFNVEKGEYLATTDAFTVVHTYK